MIRPSRHNILMGMARHYAKRSTCTRRQVGAILTRDARIISSGYNGVPTGVAHCIEGVNCFPNSSMRCTRTIHAEVNCLLFAARCGIAVDGAVLYTTLSPCRDCIGLLINAGIESVVYDQLYQGHVPEFGNYDLPILSIEELMSYYDDKL